MIALAAAVILAATPCTNCKDRPVVHTRTVVKHESILDQLKQGFAFTAGVRWDQEFTCPTVTEPAPPPKTKDPVFIGAEIRLPLYKSITAFGNYDRDIRAHGEWIQAPDWNARAGVAWRPWGK